MLPSENPSLQYGIPPFPRPDLAARHNPAAQPNPAALPNPAARQAAPGCGFESPQGFAQLVTPHLPRLVSTAREILGSDDLAWDAVQETLMRLWVRGWLPPSPAGTLAHLVRKSSLHLLRCQRRRNTHESSPSLRTGATCCDEDPLAALESAERSEAVREAVRGIAEEYRVVLELFEFHGESYEAIAKRLDLPVGTVRSRLSRGRSMLRHRLLAEFSAA